LKSDYWNVSDEQMIERPGKELKEWINILNKFKASEKKSNAGDLIHKTIKDEQGTLLLDSQIQYSTLENPLRRLMETRLDFDDTAF